ncbi:MAG: ribonuclease P protein component [Elusimicrobiota bacterium]
MKKYSFSDIRLKTRRLFLKVQTEGGRKESPSFVIYIYDLLEKKTEKPDFKFGIIVKRDTGKAVQRNRIKRLIREFFRLNRDNIKPQKLFIIKPKKICGKINYMRVENELKKLFIKNNIFKSN